MYLLLAVLIVKFSSIYSIKLLTKSTLEDSNNIYYMKVLVHPLIFNNISCLKVFADFSKQKR